MSLFRVYKAKPTMKTIGRRKRSLNKTTGNREYLGMVVFPRIQGRQKQAVLLKMEKM